MNRNQTPIRWSILLSIVTVALAGCGEPAKDAKATPAPASVKAALTATTVSLQAEEWSQGLAASGSIAAWQETVVGSELGGLRLAEVRVNVGDVVRKGELIAALADAPVEADLAQARAALAEAQAAFAEAQANGDRARKFQGSGAISQQQITQYLTAEQTAKARIDVAKARLHSEELRLRQTRIVAPDDGIVSARAATVGSVPSVGQELFRIILRGRLEWRAEVTAVDIGRVKTGAPATLKLAGGATIPGKVRSVAPAVDPQSRNGIVYVDLEGKGNQNNQAKAGMFAYGNIALGDSTTGPPAQTLPQSAVLLRDGFSWVFKLGTDRKVVQTKVATGRRVGERVEILSGLALGESVVESGVGFLADGDLVEVVANPAATPATPAPVAAAKP